MGTSQTKRENQKAAKAKKAKSRKKNSLLKSTKTVIFLTLLMIFVIGLTIWIIIDSIYAKKYKEDEGNTAVTEGSTEADSGQTEGLTIDYSACLTDEGLIEGVKALDYVTLPDLTSLSVNLSEVEPGEEDIASALESYNQTELVTDAGMLIEDGDTVNIDYVGYVDGTAFDGGDTKGSGTRLTIGSGQYIDDFEEQLIGHAPGEEVEVNVTFPENYGNEELNGKDALFNVTINGIYVTSEPSDEYIAENYSDIASTYTELKEYVINDLTENNVKEYIWNKVFEESTVDDYPEDYLANVLEVSNYMYEYEYNYYNEYMYSLNGEYQWDSIYDYYDMEQEELEKTISDDAYSQCKYYLVAQAVYEQCGLEITDADVINCITARGYTEANLNDLIANYGSGYIYQSTLGDVVMEYIAGITEVKE